MNTTDPLTALRRALRHEMEECDRIAMQTPDPSECGSLQAAARTFELAATLPDPLKWVGAQARKRRYAMERDLVLTDVEWPEHCAVADDGCHQPTAHEVELLENVGERLLAAQAREVVRAVRGAHRWAVERHADYSNNDTEHDASYWAGRRDALAELRDTLAHLAS